MSNSDSSLPEDSDVTFAYSNVLITGEQSCAPNTPVAPNATGSLSFAPGLRWISNPITLVSLTAPTVASTMWNFETLSALRGESASLSWLNASGMLKRTMRRPLK